MLRAGTSVFDDPDGYRTQFRAADVDLVFTAPGKFKARQTWIELPNLSLFRSQETLPRIASLSFASNRVFISLPTAADGGMIWNGVALQPNEVVLHRRGSRSHDRSGGVARRSYLSIDPAYLEAVGAAVAGQDWVRPASDLILQPPVRAVSHLRSLHARACKLAESNPEQIVHREAGRAIEHDLLHVLIDCLSARAIRPAAGSLARHIGIMDAFENALAANIECDIDLPRLCASIDVPERTLRLCCNKILGIGPHRYLQLRRLNKARVALQRASPATSRVAEIAQRYRFSELGRFAAAYRAVFGEMPSETLRGTNTAA